MLRRLLITGLTLCLLMVVIATALSWFIGQQLEQRLRDPDAQLPITILEIDRGIFESRITSERKLPGEERPRAFEHLVQHLVLTVGFKPVARITSRLRGTESTNATAARTEIDLHGQAHTHLSASRLQLAEMTLHEPQIEGDHDLVSGNQQIRLRATRLELTHEGRSLRADGVHARFDAPEADEWRGWFDAQSVEISGPVGSARLKMTSLSFDRKIETDGLRGDLNLTSDTIESTNARMGPLELRATADRLPQDAARLWLASGLSQGRLRDLDALAKLLGKGARFALERVYLVTEDGELDLSLLVEFKTGGALFNVLELWAGAHGQGQAQLDRRLAQRMLAMHNTGATTPDPEQRLEQLAQAGLVRIQEGRVFAQIDLAQGQLKLNGKPVPLYP